MTGYIWVESYLVSNNCFTAMFPEIDTHDHDKMFLDSDIVCSICHSRLPFYFMILPVYVKSGSQQR